MAFYSEPQRQMQDRFESRPLADVVEERIVGTELTEPQSGFVASRDFFGGTITQDEYKSKLQRGES